MLAESESNSHIPESQAASKLPTVSKYDVLLIPKTYPEAAEQQQQRQPQQPQFEFFTKRANPSPHHHHIGNNRCVVFCKMNLTSFAKAVTVEEQNAVIDSVYDIVSNQCIDTVCQRAGKFLLLQSEYLQESNDSISNNNSSNDDSSIDVSLEDASRWNELTKDQARSFLRDCLVREQREAAAIVLPPPPLIAAVATATTTIEDDKKKRRRRSSLLRRSMSGGCVPEDEKKKANYRKSVLLQMVEFDESSKADDEQDEDRDFDGRVTEARHHPLTKTARGVSAAPATSRNPSKPDPLAARGKGTSSGSLTSRKAERSPSWTNYTNAVTLYKSNNAVHTANALDVIFQIQSSTLYTLVPYHTGNMRVLVMVQLRLPRYMELVLNTDCDNNNNASSVTSTTSVYQLCAELVEAVQTNYNGRFLVEQDVDHHQEGYLCLTEEQAASALESVFRCEAAAEVNRIRSSANGFEQPNNYPPMSLSLSSPTKAHARPSEIKKHTLQQLQELAPTSFGTVHQAAIESLQKRKKRQGVNNKISQMVAINTGRVTLLERSQSTGDVDLPPPPLPPMPAPLTRFASTGDFPLSPGPLGTDGAMPQQQSDYLMSANALMDQWNEQQRHPTTWEPPNKDSNGLWHPSLLDIDQESELHHRQSRRSTTLSAFSQGMIQDLLTSLDRSSFASRLPSFVADARNSDELGNNDDAMDEH